MTLRQLRESKGISQSALARKLELTPAAIHRIESMGTTLVTTLEAYAEAIGCDFIEAWRASVETRNAAQHAVAQS